MQLTFKEQSEKIIQAYLKCELNPMIGCACFVGNLLNNTDIWLRGRAGLDFGQRCTNLCSIELAEESVKKESNNFYTFDEILALEEKFMINACGSELLEANNEDMLFVAMTKTLELLKQIHISKGEVIEEDIQLEKRQLV